MRRRTEREEAEEEEEEEEEELDDCPNGFRRPRHPLASGVILAEGLGAGRGLHHPRVHRLGGH